MHMASVCKQSSDIYLLQPELLNETALKQILELRCVKLQNMNSMSKAQLVEIFYRIATPLPQRIYKDNRRGRLLTKMRRKQERSRKKAEIIEKKSSISYGFSEASTSHEHGSHSTGDRLKPPPDTVHFEHKKIKLNSSSGSDDLKSIQMKRLKKFENSDPNGDILDRIIIKDRRKEKEKERKSEGQNMKQKQADEGITDTPLGQSRSPDSESSNGKKQLGSRKIKLKRSHCSSSSEEEPNTKNLKITALDC
ncbi:ashwin isoform X2 [Cryptotermes secundus]|uniref:ashwin isoform X2 n=1 Tax=Cryptotermes secundus TaxID=105785 RepID=UPI000CD7D89F|nr:ashwin isoform X2 [Cryptotermes secundus]